MTASLLRGSERRVANIELFFDLVYVFAVTQLSHSLLVHPTVPGALRTLLLLAMVWLVWMYTNWVTNWIDPDRVPTRIMLLALMLAGLVLSVGLPHAFDTRGLVVGGAYAVMQIGRSAFAVAALPGEALRRNFQRILVWCVVSGACAVIGGLVHGHAREAWWVAAVLVDLAGGACGFYTPGLGRSRAEVDWASVSGEHMAERCSAFVLIALGESIVATGATFADHTAGVGEITAFVAAFVGAAALWWVYFDRSAQDAARAVAASNNPGRQTTLAYHFVHPAMIGGIIAAAAGDEEVLADPAHVAHVPARWMVLGGVALFLAGHALFKLAVWRWLSVPRLAAIALLAVIGAVSAHLSALTLAICAAGIAVAVALTDRLLAAPSAALAEPGH